MGGAILIVDIADLITKLGKEVTNGQVARVNDGLSCLVGNA
jgi:hypothetical protein